jgi:Rieske Fe-S protein
MVSRRTILAGSAAAAAAAAGGCSTYKSGTPSTPSTQSSQASGTLGPVADIPVGGGKVFAGQEVVVTQPTQGHLKCFSAICTHMACTVGDVSNGTINCPCHGSQYRITDGSVVRGPAPEPLAAKKIAVANNLITLV